MKKKVAIIGTVGLPANYGGFETLAEHLVKNLGNEYDLNVYCSSKRYSKSQRKKEYEGAKLHYLPFDANGLQSIIYDTISIIHAMFYADVLIILGVAGAWMIPFVRLFTRKKVILSIDGIEWKREKWSTPARLFLFWSEGIGVKYSHIDISDNEAIQDYTASRYGSLSRIIEYGADHTMQVMPDIMDVVKYPFLKENYAFKVCRIEPENNVHLILDAFALLRTNTLVMVGNWDRNDYGRELKRAYKHYTNIIMLDPIYNQRELDLLRGNANMYIHGHSAGGTNPSLVEAMYLGLPILSFDVSYNKVTTENHALYFSTTEQLREIVKTTSSQKLKSIGQRMKEIAHVRYTWPVIASKYGLLIEEALQVTEKANAKPKVAGLKYSTLSSMNLAHLKLNK